MEVDTIKLRLCDCGWAVRLEKGKWVHVQTGKEAHITEEEAASWK